MPEGYRSALDGIDLGRTWSQVQEVASNPSENSGLALVLVACIAVALALLVIFVLMLVTPTQKKVVKRRVYRGDAAIAAAARAEAGGGPAPVPSRPPRKPPSKLFMALTGPVAVTVLVVAGLVGAYAVTSLDSFCASTCHVRSEAVASAEDVGHASCRACHERGLLTGAVANAASRARMAAAYAAGDTTVTADVAVASDSCLGCHSEVVAETIETDNGIVISHKEIVDAAIPCTDCHGGIGHVDSAFSGDMSDCLGCHNGETAFAECERCHAKDPVAAKFQPEESGTVVGTGSFDYPAVRAAKRECGGCHDQERECDSCHGIRMPHSRAFKEGGHAPAAAFERRIACWTCHDPEECGTCHLGSFNPDGTSTHGRNWKAEHKRAAWDAGCVCHEGTSTRTEPICTRCHER